MIVDFDLGVSAGLRRRCPVACNHNYEGFWFVGPPAGDPDGPRRQAHLIGTAMPLRIAVTNCPTDPGHMW